MTSKQFVQRLLDVALGSSATRGRAPEDFDEILLHLLVARVRDLTIETFDRGERELAGRLVAVFDEGLRFGDDQVENAVAVSFVEDTPWWDPARARFIESWREALRAEAARQEDWTP